MTDTPASPQDMKAVTELMELCGEIIGPMAPRMRALARNELNRLGTHIQDRLSLLHQKECAEAVAVAAEAPK